MDYTEKQLRQIQENKLKQMGIGSSVASIGADLKPKSDNPVPDESRKEASKEQATDQGCYIRDLETEGNLIETLDTESDLQKTTTPNRDLLEIERKKGNTVSRTNSTEVVFFQELFKKKWPEVLKSAVEASTRDYTARKETYDADHYHTPLWTFTRIVKSYFNFKNVVIDVDEAFNEANAVMTDWGGWVNYFDVFDDEEAYDEFESNWNKIRFLFGETVLDKAMLQANEYPLDLEQVALPRYQLFISMVGWLQVSAGDNYILLPCKNVSDAFTRHGIECNKMSVSRMRDRAEQAGYLREVSRHKFDPKDPQAEKRATRFRFDLSHFSILVEAAEAMDAEE